MRVSLVVPDEDWGGGAGSCFTDGIRCAGCSSWTPLKTEKELVSYYQQVRNADDSPLIYLDTLPFSARFYSDGTAVEVTKNGLNNLQGHNTFQRLYVAVPRTWSDDKVAKLSNSARKIMENRRHQLLVIEGLLTDQQPVSNANGARSNDT
ncbi:hypothetical protein [Marinobacter sp. AC-23]|uniref:hypothetical protein n=1 Tax=Marinobacter sp. AC-23 TaxID=1879031 RepID=UPI0020C8EDD8|nr:hypothetical protein [Marinobacter sp. AC-23]